MHLKDLFGTWHAQKVKERLDSGNSVENTRVDLPIKPIHFKWLTMNLVWLAQHDGCLIRTGMERKWNFGQMCICKTNCSKH